MSSPCVANSIGSIIWHSSGVTHAFTSGISSKLEDGDGDGDGGDERGFHLRIIVYLGLEYDAVRQLSVER